MNTVQKTYRKGIAKPMASAKMASFQSVQNITANGLPRSPVILHCWR